ncbi:MAG: GEVED domain-containing protein [Cyanobacteria bacterium P01_A01_bin.105]
MRKETLPQHLSELWAQQGGSLVRQQQPTPGLCELATAINPISGIRWTVGLLGAGTCLLFSMPAQAQTAISGVNATYQAGTASSYNTQVANPCITSSYPSGCDSNITMQFGVGATNDLNLSGFNVGAQTYDLVDIADQIEFRRVDNAAATGERQLSFFESGSSNDQVRVSYINTMADALLGSTMNRGADNVFSNQAGDVASNNIERIDYIVSTGLAVPSTVLNDIGFLILERGGNDPFKIAAITSLDASGNPNGFGPLQTVATSNWGNSGYTLQTTVMRREQSEPNYRPSHIVGAQPVRGVFTSLADLGTTAGQTIYGYALFPSDINASNDLINLSDFPTDTSGGSGEGGMDLVAGGGIFAQNNLNTISGTLYEDTDGGDDFDSGEPGLPPDITVNLLDSGGTVIATTVTNANGEYAFFGIADGNYTVQVDTADSDIPSGLTLGTPNDLGVTVAGSDVTNQNFGFDDAAPSLTSCPAGSLLSEQSVLSFQNPVAEPGTTSGDLSVGATYRFPNVISGTDAIVEVVGANNASLVQLDVTSTGFASAFQPEVRSNSTSSGEYYVDFEVRFVQTGTTTPLTVSTLLASGLDIDGDNTVVREVVQFGGNAPVSYTVETPSNLTVSQLDSSTVRFESTTSLVNPGINLTTENMGSVEYNGISVFNYRAGMAIGNSAPSNVSNQRLNSLYFDCVSYDNPNTTVPSTPSSLDFGDAPSSYGDASHDITSLFLGSTVDGEAGTQLGGDAGAGADGDDGDGSDDEDGVVFSPSLGFPNTVHVVQAGATNTVNVDASGAGTLNAWIDYNQDGDFDDAGEQIFTDTALIAGGNSLTFAPDSRLPHGDTYARFRFSTQTGLGPEGTATDGEVEDYAVKVAAPVAQVNACAVTGLWDGSFEQLDVGSSTNHVANFGSPPTAARIYNDDDVPGWNFAPSDGTGEFIELWQSQHGGGSPGFDAYEGGQHAEINAYENGALFQDVVTTPGTVMGWQFAHRGRTGTDTLRLNIGVPGSTISQGNFSTGNDVNAADEGWVLYSGTYTVPPGQYVTRFGFEAVSTANGRITTGNFVDDVKFSLPPCVPAVASDPNVLLVKRITAVNGGTTTVDGDDLAIYLDESGNPYDDNDVTVADPVNPGDPPADTDQWPSITTNLLGGVDGGNVVTNDEIEYTIYFLSSGETTAENVLFCDYVPTYSMFIPDGYAGSTPVAPGGITGADLSIKILRNGATDYHTGAIDGDAATYFPPGVDPADSFPNIDCENDGDGVNANPNGAVVVNLGDLPDAGTSATGAYGYVQFRARVK